MGAYTTNMQVWYPDTSDTAKLNTLLATLASSIETGIGGRIIKVETTRSLLATVTAGSVTPLSNGGEKTIPFSINPGGYNDGMTIAPTGIVTVNVSGLYYMAVNSMTTQASGYMDLRLYKNAGNFTRALGHSGTNGGGFAAAGATGIMQCNAGDSLQATVTVNGVAASAQIHTGQVTYNVMSIVLLKAS